MNININDNHRRQVYAKARFSRDARFDGVFFIGVKTTGIYCRPICPANSPHEKNVEYHSSAISAAQAGFRPCLRCRPDSAPQSSAWLGNETTFRRALELVQQGALQEHSLEHLSDRLGISSRYLRGLFQQHLGTSPKKYAIYQQCLFAKQLLHDSSLSITDIAFASGFNSIRRFNEAMQQQIGLTPREIRKSDKKNTGGISLKLYYRPPYAWEKMLSFLQTRAIEGLEWGQKQTYGRTIHYKSTDHLPDTKGYFTIKVMPEQHRLDLSISLNQTQHLNPIVQRIRALFDIDAPIERIDQTLFAEFGEAINYLPGLRLPGIWGHFEAGVRAILGQQVSVSAAKKLVTDFVEHLGEPMRFEGMESARFLFPEAIDVMDSSLDFFRMPQARKDTIRRLAEHFLNTADPHDVDAWLDIKGIGPWTVNYVKMRANKDPDIWLAGDAGLKNALKNLCVMPSQENAEPWRSYLTMQLWNQLQ